MKETQKLALMASLPERPVQTCLAEALCLLQSSGLQGLQLPLTSVEQAFCALFSRNRSIIARSFKVIGELFKYMEIINECIQMEIRQIHFRWKEIKIKPIK